MKNEARIAAKEPAAAALDVLSHIDGHLLADIRAMRHWATLASEPPVGMGRLNFALMAVALIGCERLGFLVWRHAKHSNTRRQHTDDGRYIIGFIDHFFPPKHPFKRIPKILADSVRHELVHGFGARSATGPFDIGLYVSGDPAKLYEVRRDKQRPILAINAVAFADAVLLAFARLQKRVASEPVLADAVVTNATVPFTTPNAVLAEWNSRVLRRSRKTGP